MEEYLGLGGRLELPLLKGVFLGGGLLNSHLNGYFVFFCCSAFVKEHILH